jgi:anaerobic selenocysteine-containing dehydrogenase
MEVFRTVCGMCGNDACGIEAYVENNRVVRIRGNPESPLNGGRLCVQSQGALELLSSPNQLDHPLRREGSTWQRLTWDEALDIIAERLLAAKARYGAHSFVLWSGEPMWQFIRDGWHRRFLNLFGSPNWACHDFMCHTPSVIAEKLTYGQSQLDGFEPEHARCVVLWGSNPATSHNPHQWHAVLEARRRGASLIVVDPRRCEPASRADLHLALRPGTDGALALGLIHILIAEKLYDADFVVRWTTGFDELAIRVAPYTPERVAAITGLAPADILRFARVYASARPAHLDVGNAVERHSNAGGALRALMILRALSGNLDVPGGHVLGSGLPLAGMHLSSHRPTGVRTLGAERYPLFSEYAQSVPGDVLVDAMLTGAPYPVKAALVMGTNPMLTYPNTARIQKALAQLDLLVVMDLTMTPTARLADIVLPAASASERTQLITNSAPFGADRPWLWLALRRQIIEAGDRRSDWWLLRNLAHRLGYGAYYPWENEEEAIEDVLRPLGVTLDELKAQGTGMFYGEPAEHRRYERNGFRTPTGKVELHSTVLESYGYDPLPGYEEPAESPLGVPELLRQPGLAQEYPLILNAGYRVGEYTHSRYRDLPTLRRRVPEPIAELHPNTARQFDIADGDWVVVATPRGQIELKARVTDAFVPGAVGLLPGWEEANANWLTDDRQTDPVFATPALNSASCSVRRKTPGLRRGE